MKTLIAILVAMFVVSATIPAVVSAAQPQEAVFGETVATDTYVSVVPLGNSGNTAIVGLATGEYPGVVTGEFVQTDYFTLHANGTGTFHGVDTCTCTIDGRTGSLVIRYTGTMASDGTF